MCHIPIWKLQIEFPGQNVNMNFQVTTTAAAATATTSQELSQSGKSPDPSRAGTKYPVQESLTSIQKSNLPYNSIY